MEGLADVHLGSTKEPNRETLHERLMNLYVRLTVRTVLTLSYSHTNSSSYHHHRLFLCFLACPPTTSISSQSIRPMARRRAAPQPPQPTAWLWDATLEDLAQCETCKVANSKQAFHAHTVVTITERLTILDHRTVKSGSSVVPVYPGSEYVHIQYYNGTRSTAD